MIVAYVHKSVPSKHMNQSEWNLLYNLQRVSGWSKSAGCLLFTLQVCFSLPRKHNLFNTIHKATEPYPVTLVSIQYHL